MKKVIILSSLLLLSGCFDYQNDNKQNPIINQETPKEVARILDTCIGVECRVQPKTVEEFIPVFAEQIKKYNTFADSLWPNNAVKDFLAIAVTMDKTKAWKIFLDGSYTSIPVKEVDNYGDVLGYDTEFVFFVDGDKNGVILTINEESLKNPEVFEKYAHLGTYDIFITYIHESFHVYEQPKWLEPENIINKEREEFLDKYEARASRAVIIQQLLNAFIYPEEKTAYIKKAVATYREYQKNFPDDALNTQYWDRIEGTAYYVELISSFKVGYPELQSIDDIYFAYGKAAKTVDIVGWMGAVSEGYITGGLAGVLLDTLNQTNWKTELMQNASLSPIEMLAKLFDDKITPQDVVAVSDDLMNTYKELAEQENQLDDTQIENIIVMLKKVKEENMDIYNELVKQFQTENPELMEKILPLLE